MTLDFYFPGKLLQQTSSLEKLLHRVDLALLLDSLVWYFSNQEEKFEKGYGGKIGLN